MATITRPIDERGGQGTPSEGPADGLCERCKARAWTHRVAGREGAMVYICGECRRSGR
jgi:hypothetical protein